MAPPLDGVWASAPYFHNGSVPTVAGVLESGARPQYWTRSFDSKDYDPAALGWQHSALDHGHAGEPDAAKRQAGSTGRAATVRTPARPGAPQRLLSRAAARR